MIKILNNEDCCGCSSCYNICPKQCISMNEDCEGFLYPVVNKDNCIECNLCIKSCPIINKTVKQSTPIRIIGFRDENNSNLTKSSSGGFFGKVAEFILMHKGYVIAACFNEKFEVIHKITDDIKDINKFKKSKYVQSNLDNIFSQLKKIIPTNKPILFVGTPCQVSGLLSFLKTRPKNLYLIDFVCHGVPSPKIWRNYVKTLGENIYDIDFRDKSTGWPSYSFSYKKDGIKYSTLAYNNPYFRGFINNLYLRPSCYSCKFKNFSSGADLTISDFWGVWKKYPKWNDNKGASCIAINTKLGNSLISLLKLNNNTIDIDFKSAYIDYNFSAIVPSKLSKKRSIFFEKYNSKNFEYLVNKLTKESFYIKIKNYLHTIKYKLL